MDNPQSAITASSLNSGDYSGDYTGPLSGIKVLDLSRLFAGNLLSQTLADFGADVVKIEPKDGDTLRGWRCQGVETNWKLYARNKRSLGLKFRHPEASELVLRLVKNADVFIESFRPGTLEAMGLAPDILLQNNPRLIIVRISGWGQDGPYHRRPGFGTLIEGIAGFASINGFADREPVLPPMYLADAFAGSYGSTAVLIALREVQQNGGKGQVVDLPLLDPLFHVLGPQAANFQLTGRVKLRVGSRSTNSGPRNAYKTSDARYVALSASTQKMAERLFRSIGRPDLIEDPRYATNAERVRHVDELDDIIAEFIVQKTQSENVAFFERAEVTIGPIYDISQIVQDEHFRERNIVVMYPDEEMGAFPMHHVVPRLSETPGAVHRRAPKLAEHTREVLQEFGFGENDVGVLISKGIVFNIPSAEK
jgi:crotonobetainyl-CoA:carnitine CoA-transferase CaiB-like acyl-CoA transferase